MLKINAKMLALLFVTIFITFSTILFQNQKESAVQEAEKRIDIFMSKWLALFDYIEVKQKDIFYKLEEDGLLKVEGYFDQRVLSFTYIAREIQKKYEEIEREKGNIPYRYRLAATTPRNVVNQATTHEVEILERFRKGEIEKFSEYIIRENEKFYVSYKPIAKTDESCMRCHSTPERAPKGLVDRYGAHAGFDVPLDYIRALIVMEIPFSEIEEEAFNHFILSIVIMLSILLVFYITLVTILNKEKMLTQANEKLERLSNTDRLTGVANRRYFDSYILQQWNRIRRDRKHLSLIMCDVDHFKLYNDTYGHQVGDECLAKIANVILDSFSRSTDFIARYGGEEFAIILPNTDNEGAVKVAMKIQSNIVEANIAHEKSTCSSIATLSMGVSTIVPHKDTSIDELIRNADELLYRAKEKGRNCIIY